MARMLNGWDVYSCLIQQVSFQIDEIEFDLKRNSLGRS